MWHQGFWTKIGNLNKDLYEKSVKTSMMDFDSCKSTKSTTGNLKKLYMKN